MVKFAPSGGSTLFREFSGPLMSTASKYVKVHEAAEILGVAPNTVRKWGETGKIPEYRHPANGYRLYKREELEEMMSGIEASRKYASSCKR